MIARVRDLRNLAWLLACVVLAGAAAFGLWHVVVGGLVHGNARAAGFGIVLAVAAGGLLGGALAVRRRRGA